MSYHFIAIHQKKKKKKTDNTNSGLTNFYIAGGFSNQHSDFGKS